MRKRYELFSRQYAKFFVLLLLFSGNYAGCLGHDSLEERVEKMVKVSGMKRSGLLENLKDWKLQKVCTGSAGRWKNIGMSELLRRKHSKI